MEQPFYIGQKVVCIKSHSWGLVKEGDIKTVTEVGVHPCGRGWVSVGVRSPTGLVHCHCGSRHRAVKEMKFYPERFAPIQEGFEAITFERVMEEEKISVN